MIGVQPCWTFVRRLVAIGILVAANCFRTANAASLDQSVRVMVARSVSQDEKFLLRDDETIIEEIPDQRGIAYALLGYVGRERGFSEIMFSAADLHFLALPLLFDLDPDPKTANVVAVFTDGPLEHAGLVSSLMGVPDGATRRDEKLFKDACVLTHLYVKGHLFKTIAAMDVTTEGKRPLVPAACLLAAIVIHSGLHGVAALAPEEFVQVEQSGRLLPRAPMIAALSDLYGSGVQQGMTREEAKRRLAEYLTPRVRKYLETEGHHGGGR